MSKILDLLNYNRWDKKSGAAGKAKAEGYEHITHQNFDVDTREKLASTYIFNPIENTKEAKPGPKIETAHRKDKKITAEPRLTAIFPWFISFLAVLLLLVNIAFRGKIVINIDVIPGAEPKIPAVMPEKSASKDDIAPKAEGYQEMRLSVKPKSITLAGVSMPDKGIIKKVGFYGAALSKSKAMEGGFLLFNDGTAGYASTAFDLSYPMDLEDSTLDFFVKGTYGNESLKLFLRDAGTKSYMPQAVNFLFKKNMGADWQFVSIPFKNFTGSYDPKAINHIGFEFGTQTTQNEPGTSIYIKNIKIVSAAAASQ